MTKRGLSWQLGTTAGVLLVIGLVSAAVLTRGGGQTRPTPPPTPAPVERPAAPPPSRVDFGASVNTLYNYSLFSPAQIDAQLAALRQTGATLARSDALWEAAEPTPPSGGVHRYDWNFDDRIAGTLAARGLRWLPIIDYSPLWASSVVRQDHAPPRLASDYAAYAGAFAARYGAGGLFWRSHPELKPEPVDTYEIWNEPDTAFFWLPAPDPARYADLYQRARAAIIAHDPEARVIVGGLAHLPTTLPAMVEARPALRGHIDGVAIHPYAPRPGGVVAAVRADRKMMIRVGLGDVPLYVSEVGWATKPPHSVKWAPLQLRPILIARTLSALGHSNCGIAAVVLYSWVTPELNASIMDNWFGIHPPAGGSTADTKAFATAVRDAARPGARPAPPTAQCD